LQSGFSILTERVLHFYRQDLPFLPSRYLF
jgi:hypothetical protein